MSGHMLLASKDSIVPYIPSALVEVSVSAANLLDKDVISLSDPMCVLFLRDMGQTEWREHKRTETIRNNLNPQFVKKFYVDYYFEEKQYLRFELYDIDKESLDLKHHAPLGCFECTLGNLVSCLQKEGPLQPLNGRKTRGTISLIAEEVTESKEHFEMTWCGRGLDKKDLFGKSDPFLEFSRKHSLVDSYSIVHRTEHILSTLDPDWSPFSLSSQELCNGDYDREILVKCYDWNKSGRHALIGEFRSCLKAFNRGPGAQNEYKLIHPKKQKKKGVTYRDSGKIVLKNIQIQAQHSFLDYVKSGMTIHVTVAIDFTRSNGLPPSPESLHHISDSGVCNNPYARAIEAVVSILEDYDSDKRISAFGFGAKLQGESKVCDMFPLMGSRDGECEGTSGVLKAYKETLANVAFFGPSNFATIIHHVSKESQKVPDGSAYHILLILTDGELSDMIDTSKAIIQAATGPLSIIIVGIGKSEENFEAMRILDGDNKRLSCRTQVAQRDIVQFVEFRKFEGLSQDNSHVLLAKEVLREVPLQVCSFMQSRKIIPRVRSQRRRKVISTVL